MNEPLYKTFLTAKLSPRPNIELQDNTFFSEEIIILYRMRMNNQIEEVYILNEHATFDTRQCIFAYIYNENTTFDTEYCMFAYIYNENC